MKNSTNCPHQEYCEMREQSDWHTKRLPTATRRSASSMAKLPHKVPLEPPTSMFLGFP